MICNGLKFLKADLETFWMNSTSNNLSSCILYKHYMLAILTYHWSGFAYVSFLEWSTISLWYIIKSNVSNMSHSRRIVGCNTCIWFFFLLLTFRFQEWGLEKGWGDTSEHVLEMIHLLLDILQAPDPSTLEKFLGRIPMIFNVVVVSPHGYFGQANVLGLPDTGGQVNWGR